MTYTHFILCTALSYVPPYVIYKSTRLAEHNSISNIVGGVLGFAFTQFVKMLLIATFIPISNEGDVSQLDWIQEFLKMVIACVDILGMYLLFKLRVGPSNNECRILGNGLGWAVGEAVLQRFMPLWLGSRGLEFDWKYMQMSILSNINMALYIAFAALVFLITSQKADSKLKQMSRIGLFAFITFPLIQDVICHFLKVQSSGWIGLIIHGVLTLLLSILAHQLYKKYEQQIKKQN